MEVRISVLQNLKEIETAEEERELYGTHVDVPEPVYNFEEGGLTAKFFEDVRYWYIKKGMVRIAFDDYTIYCKQSQGLIEKLKTL